MRGVMERPQHPGDVVDRGAFELTHAQRPGRLSFEVDDDEVLPRVQDLPQVIVAVNTDAEAGDLAIAQQPEAPVESFLEIEDSLGLSLRTVGKAGEAPAQER